MRVATGYASQAPTLASGSVLEIQQERFSGAEPLCVELPAAKRHSRQRLARHIVRHVEHYRDEPCSYHQQADYDENRVGGAWLGLSLHVLLADVDAVNDKTRLCFGGFR
jgi:hypothetical protein